MELANHKLWYEQASKLEEPLLELPEYFEEIDESIMEIDK